MPVCRRADARQRRPRCATAVRSVSTDRRITTLRGRRRSSSRLRVCGRRCSRIMWARFRLAAAVSAGESAGMRGPTPTNNMQRPSAGTFSNRETNNPGNRTCRQSAVFNANWKPRRIPAVHAAEQQHSPVDLGNVRNGRARVSIQGSTGSSRTHGTAARRDAVCSVQQPGRIPAFHSAIGQRSVARHVERSGDTRQQRRLLEPDCAEFGANPAVHASYSGATGADHRPVRSWICGSRLRGHLPTADIRRGGYAGYRGAPSYGGPRGAPSYGGSHSAPSYGGGGRPSAPSGGGHSSGGGGGHPSVAVADTPVAAATPVEAITRRL